MKTARGKAPVFSVFLENPGEQLKASTEANDFSSRDSVLAEVCEQSQK